MFQFTGFPSCHYLFMTWWHAVNVPRFRIRKSMGHCLLAADHGLSQLTTSFFGSWCQGIHPMLFIAWSLVLSAILTHEFRFRARALRTLAFAFVIISFLKSIEIAAQIIYITSRFIFFVFFSANLLSSLCSCQGSIGGLKWTRTTDLALIRRAL